MMRFGFVALDDLWSSEGQKKGARDLGVSTYGTTRP